ncbi:MAG: BREX system ATP-binding domain-containing protein [bacterium]
MKGKPIGQKNEQKTDRSSHRLFSRPPLIGRGVELAFLENYLDSARDGQGRLLFISGEPGIGKTFLVEELKRRAAESGQVKVLTGLCSPQRRDVPYSLFRELFTSHIETIQDSGEREKARVLMANALPEFAAGIAPEFDSPGKEERIDDPDLAKRKMFYSVCQILFGLATEAPLLIVLEDIHWADASSLLLLHSVVRNSTRAKILIVATYRLKELLPDKRGANHHLTDVLQRMARELLFERLELQRLSRRETDSLLRWYFPQSDFTDPFLGSMYLKTKGNPYFLRCAVELMLAEKSIIQSGGIWSNAKEASAVTIPDTLTELVGRRISSLEDATRTVLECAATIGHRFPSKIISEVTEIPEMILLKMLSSLEQDCRIIRSEGEEYIFEHPLIGEVLYCDMNEERRRLFHHKIGDAMEEIYRDRLDSIVEELAFRFSNAGDDTKALPYLEQAGERARTLLGYQEALTCYESALSILENTPTIRDRDRRRMHLMMCAGEMNQTLGQWDRSLENFRKALELSEKLKDEKMEGRALTQIGLAYAKRSKWSEAESFYNRSMLIFQHIGDRHHIGLTLTSIADIHFERCEWQKAKGLYEEALNTAMRTVDKCLMAKIYNNLGAIADIRGDLMDTILNYSKCLDLYKESEDYLSMARVYHKLGVIHANRLEWKKAIEFYDRSIALSEKIGELGQASLTYLNKAVAALHLSEVPEAERWCDLAGHSLIRVEDPLGLAECNKIMGIIGVQKKEWHYAQRRFEESIRIFESCENLLGLAENLYEMGTMYTVRGMKGKALDAFQRSMNIYKELGFERRVEETAEKIFALAPETEM